MSFYSCVNSTLATFGFLTTAFLEIGMALCSRSILLNNNNKTTDISPYNCKSKDQYTSTTYIFKKNRTRLLDKIIYTGLFKSLTVSKLPI